jgi:serine/threonine-protein kinase
VGRYALYGKIASGGMATLHFGRLLGPSGFARTVAVKCLYPQFAQDPDFSAMFLDEARLVSRIRSPYVVPTLDVVSEDGELAIVMEYVHGESLGVLVPSRSDGEARRPSRPEVPVEVAVAVLCDVLEGLHAAHEARSEQGQPLGIVHRDVSPQNILVGTDGLGHLIDFGVAKATGRLQTTREGQLKGKLAYMSPEQLRGEPVTRRSDVYAASVVLWEALVGERLFGAGDEGATVTRVLMGEIAPPSQAVRRNRPSGQTQAIERLDAVVMRGLDRQPANRFETARDMAVALERCVARASAAEVARWLEEVAAPELTRRAAAITAIENGAAHGETASAVSGRRVGLWLAAGVLVSGALVATRISVRSRAGSPTPVPTSVALPSSEPSPAETIAAGPSESAVPVSSASSAPASAAASARRGPVAAPRASDCVPPFTWDSEGKKHYKRQCL